MNRRQALGRLGGLFAAGLAGSAIASDSTSETANIINVQDIKPGGPLTIAHVTDIHITDQMHSEKWVAECFRQIQSHPSKPSLILNTGDCIYDSMKTDRAQTEKYWKIWQKAMKDNVSLPMQTVLGNHDVWGVALSGKDPAMKDPLFGKKMGLLGAGLKDPYYSFDKGGWHFIMLDSVTPIFGGKQNNWKAELDEQQFKWLKKDLEATSKTTPVLVCSHNSIIQICSMTTQQPSPDKNYEFGPKDMMADARRIIDLFKNHSNVKLCFSGHMHRLDRIESIGVTYICDGSVCGDKWKGDNHGVPCGYSISTLHPDGKFDYEYIPYGWKQLG